MVIDVTKLGSALQRETDSGTRETSYVLEGNFTVTGDGRAHELAPGQALLIGRGRVHSFDNTGGVDGAFLSVATPGVFRPADFLEIAQVLDASPGGPPGLDDLFSVMVRHGLTPALPGVPPNSDN